MSQIFTKNYTRESSLIIQEIWLIVSREIIDKYLPRYCDQLYGIDYINNGVFEIWENKKVLAAIKDLLVSMSHKNKKELMATLQHYQSELSDLNLVWQKLILPQKELLAFIKKVKKLMLANIIYSYLGTIEETEPEIKKISAELRKEDRFFANNIAVFRASLKKLFPTLKKYINYLRISEIKKNTPGIKELSKRYINFIGTSQGEFYISTLKNFQQKNPEYIFFEEAIKPLTVIKGQIASPGQISGKVRIIKKVADSYKTEKGEIIVSPMTTPDMIAGLKNAGAIVTDEGGILCHASLVSRELGIPCLIGTKIATKVLKNGDFVKVDAEKGIVKILQKTN